MNERNKRFNKDYLIGKNAENVFEYIINSMDDWEIINYGVENHIKELKRNLKTDYSEVAEKIRHMPDFVVLNKKENRLMFFEVKRAFIKKENGKELFGFKKNQIDKYLTFWKETKLFLVHKEVPYFFIIDLKDVDVNKNKAKSNMRFDSENSMNNSLMDLWDFKDNKKDLKEIFSNLSEEIIKEAKKGILIMEQDK